MWVDCSSTNTTKNKMKTFPPLRQIDVTERESVVSLVKEKEGSAPASSQAVRSSQQRTAEPDLRSRDAEPAPDLGFPSPRGAVCLCGRVLTGETWNRSEISQLEAQLKHRHITVHIIAVWGRLEPWDDRGQPCKSVHENWNEKLLLLKATKTWRLL